MSFRDNLLRLRTERGMTQEQLATLLGVSRQSVAKWESEKTYPEMDKLIKMTGIFHCTLDELVMGRPEQTKATEDEPVSKPQSRTTLAEEINVSHGGDESLANDIPNSAAIDGPSVVTDAYGYDTHMRKCAKKAAWGAVCIVLGVVAALITRALIILASGFGADTSVMFAPLAIGIAAGIALIAAAVRRHLIFTQNHPSIENFYTYDQKRLATNKLTMGVVIGIALILAGLLGAERFYMIASFIAIFLIGGGVSDQTAFQAIDGLPGALMLLFLAGAIWCFVYFGVMYKRVHVGERK